MNEYRLSLLLRKTVEDTTWNRLDFQVERHYKNLNSLRRANFCVVWKFLDKVKKQKLHFLGENNERTIVSIKWHIVLKTKNEHHLFRST